MCKIRKNYFNHQIILIKSAVTEHILRFSLIKNDINYDFTGSLALFI